MGNDRAMYRRIVVLLLTAAAGVALFGSGCLPGLIAVDAGADQTIDIDQGLTLQGSVSGGAPPYTYAWTPADRLSDRTALKPMFSPAVVGEYTYTLTVTDSAGQTASDDVTITVTTTNEPVVAEAGPTRATAVGQAVTLNGSATGGDGDYTYSWSPTTGLSDPSAAQPAFTPTAVGSTTFTLTVTDGEGVSDTDTVTVTVLNATAVSSVTWGVNQADTYLVTVVFSQNLDRTTAETAANYRIAGTTQTPTSAVLADDLRTVTLTFAGPLAISDRLDISVGSAILDDNGNPVTAVTNRAIAANTSDDTAPSVTSRVWAADYAGSYQLAITFDEVLDETSAETKSAYRINSTNTTALGATLGTDGRTVTVVFDNVTLSATSTIDVSVSNTIKDINGNVLLQAVNQDVASNPADTTAPSVVSVEYAGGFADDGYGVVVVFDEAMDQSTVEQASGWRLGVSSANSATLADDARTVTVVFEALIDTADELDISVGDRFKDINGNAMSQLNDQTVESSSTDSTSPSVASIQWEANYAAGGYRILVVFNEALDGTTAGDEDNYRINGTSSNPTTATLATDGRTVTLEYDIPLQITDKLDVSVGDTIQDINGNTMNQSLGRTISANSETTLPTITAATWAADYDAGGYQLTVAFSEAMDETSAETASYYRINGTAMNPATATLASDGMTVTLAFDTLALNTSTTLDVSLSAAIKDINGRGVAETLGQVIAANAGAAAPSITSVTHGAGRSVYTVIITFDRAMDETTVETLANYDINNGDNVAPATASLAADGLTATLTWTAAVLTQPWAIADTMDVSLGDAVTDINGQALAAVAARAISANPADSTAPATPSVSHVAASNNIVLVFAEVLDEATVETAAYATDKGGVNLTGAVLGDDGRTVTLTFDADPGNGAGGQALTIPGTILDINGNAFAGATPVIPN